MPWRVTDPMLEKLKFVAAVEASEVSFRAICAAFGVSRATGYRVWQRYRAADLEGLRELSRRPKRSPSRTTPAVEAELVRVRLRFPLWSAKKLVAYLRRRAPEQPWPSAVTVHRILRRRGLIEGKRRRRRSGYPGAGGFRVPESPNEVWTADFKGQFRLKNRRLCYPLTIGDLFSRYALECRALDSTRVEGARPVFERVFRHYGLPERIRTDNGVPFGSGGLCGLSGLSVWWLKLGIELERIEPGCPEQNGAHERFHRTLKEAATRPAEQDQRAQQVRLERFRREYNELRPHEGLAMAVPADRYQHSPRKLPRRGEYPGLDYPAGWLRRQVRPSGVIKWQGGRLFISEVLAGEPVALEEVGTETWLVRFGPMLIGLLEGETFNPAHPERKTRRSGRVSHMS